MRTTTLLDELRIGEIKPDPAYDRYFALLRQDVAALLADAKHTFVERACPGCGRESVAESFTKEGLNYHDCPDCHSMFVSPVPPQSALDELSQHGRSARFRREMFAHELAVKRAEHLHNSLLQWITITCEEHDVEMASLCDVGSDDEAWLRALEGDKQFARKSFVTPLAGLEGNGSAQFTNDLAGTQGPFSVICCFSALDKVSDPVTLLDGMAERLQPGGILFITTSTSSGLEYRLLGRDAPSLAALDRLTMFSIEALQDGLRKRNLNVVELSTPGRLDVEALAEYMREHPAARQIPFWGYLFGRGDEKLMGDLQLFLQRNLLSSYARVAARKPA